MTHMHVLLAREASTGVVLMRRSGRLYCSLGWNRETDEFHLGQWLRGPIEFDLSALSPDGRYLLYCAEKRGKWFTAISRAPYLTAVVYAPGNADRFDWVAGAFTSNHTYWLADRDGPQFRSPALDDLDPDPGDEPPPFFREFNGYLDRDGWTRRSLLTTWHSRPYDYPAHSRVLPGDWLLERGWFRGELPNFQWVYRLSRPGTGICHDFLGWEWADWDRHRMVWAARGQVWSGDLGDSGLHNERCLADFNDLTFEPIVAPYEGYRSPRGGT